jgi:predicted unusual protein kinase regulating ubiquinone biosynthesis (AarF/ABC1/UbiB family)
VGSLTDPALLEKHLRMAQEVFESLHPRMRAYVLEEALAKAIDSIKVLPVEVDIPSQHPWHMYQNTLRQHLLTPLKRDGHIPTPVLEHMLGIFLQAPSRLQARLLLLGLRHAGRLSEDPHQQALLACDLLSHGGIVAVKLGQILAEMPEVPLLYRSLLGHLRDQTEPMSCGMFWHQMTESTRKTMVALGPLLGAGSVKQVHQAWRHAEGRCAVAVLREGVEKEAVESFAALEHQDDYRTLARSLSRVVYHEFDLMAEAESLLGMASTSIGQHRLFKVVDVLHADPRCLIETVADGPTIAKALSGVSPYDADERKSVLAVLAKYHEVVLHALSEEGVVHSDCHLGNASVVRLEEPEGFGFVLYDTGQVQRLSAMEVKAVILMLSSFAAPQKMLAETLKHLAAETLAPLCRGYNTASAKSLQKRIESALQSSTEKDSATETKDMNAMYLHCLRNMEDMGVHVPKGVFAVAKMLDALRSQQITYALPDALTPMVTSYLKAHLSWLEAGRMAWASLWPGV